MKTSSKVALTCSYCSKVFFRERWKHNASIKKGVTKVYCSRECSDKAKLSNKRVLTKVSPERIANARQGLYREACINCEQKSVGVINSHVNKHGHRRRTKECSCCNHRTVTYEITEDMYVTLDKNSDQQQVNPCMTCAHNKNHSCSFDFPEYLSPDSIDCNHYQQ